MQNWETLPQANYEHNWYGNMFSTIKREPITSAYNVDHHHMTLPKGANTMEMGIGSPTSPSSHHQTDGSESHPFYGMGTKNHPLGFNPLTPPGYPNPIIPQINFSQDLGYSESCTTSVSTTAKPLDQASCHDKVPQTEATQSLTPSHTPPMDITPPKSPKSLPATPEKDNEASSNSNDSGEDMRYAESDNDNDNDDESITKPKFNSHGKVKKFKCKQCGYIAITKVDFWAHAREHIKPEKLLECHFCPFVTELKHHLEYHIRKHKNLKPFQCDQCSYSCVNKSMLNSHLKSHSKVYQYRCADCDYATKYCHSFKLHLRKYTHKPGMVLNEDGTPNPLIIIDVYGTRRGPKMKGRENSITAKLLKQESRAINQKMQHSMKTSEPSVAQRRTPPLLNNQPQNLVSNLLPSTIANMLQQSRNLPFFPYLNLNLQMLAAQQQAVLAQLSPNMRDQSTAMAELFNDESSKYGSEPDDTLLAPSDQNIHDAMDLTQASPVKSGPPISERTISFGSEIDKKRYSSPPRLEAVTATPILSSSKMHRRKGRAFKFDAAHNDEVEDEDDLKQPAKLTLLNLRNNSKASNNEGFTELGEVNTDVEKQPAPISNSTLGARTVEDPDDRLTPKNTYECKSCGIFFRDAVLHTIHMGYHSCDDEFKCNMCGERCGDRLTFFVHIARFPHS